MTDLLTDLKARGFSVVQTGGGCEALYRFDAERNETTMITDTSGSELPSDESWLYCVHDGDWGADDEEGFNTEPKDFGDSECSPVHLQFLLDMPRAE